MKRLLLTIALAAGLLAPVTSRAAEALALDNYVGKNLKFVFTMYNSAEEGAAPFSSFTSEIIKGTDGKFYLTNFMNLGDLQIIKTYNGSSTSACQFGTKYSGSLQQLSNISLQNSDGATISMKTAIAEKAADNEAVTTYKFNSRKFIPDFFKDDEMVNFVGSSTQSKVLTRTQPLLIEYGKTDDKNVAVVSKMTITVLQNCQDFSYADTPEETAYSGYTTSDNIFNYGNLGVSVKCSSTATTEPYTLTIPSQKLYTVNDVTISGDYDAFTITTNSANATEYWLTGTDGSDMVTSLTPKDFEISQSSKWFNGTTGTTSKIYATTYNAVTASATIRNNSTGEIIKTVPGCRFTFTPGEKATIVPTATITVNKIGYDNNHGLYANVTAKVTKGASFVENYDVMVIPAKSSFTAIEYATNPDGTSISTDDATGLAGAYALSEHATEWTPEQAATFDAMADDSAADADTDPYLTKTFNAQIEDFKDAYDSSTADAKKNFTFFVRYNIKNDTNAPKFGGPFKTQNLTGDIVTGVEDAVIDTDSDATPVYYNLQGVRVNNPTKGIYLEVRGDKVTKVIK